MSDPYIGEIRLFGFTRAPTGWFICDGTLLPISGYEPLFAIIGTYYGGNGQSNFALPDLRGRVPIHIGQGFGLPNYDIGQNGGEETHTLLDSEMPRHSHALVASTTAATTTTPATNVHLATTNIGYLYALATNVPSYDVMEKCVGSVGGSLGHQNMMPTIVANYCIAYSGVFPSRG